MRGAFVVSPHRRRLLFAALYFSEGAPIGWLWWTLPPQLREAGFAVDEIQSWLAAFTLVWTFKFVWAPLLDVLRTRWFGRRAWLVSAQLGMLATLVPLMWLEPAADWGTVSGLLLAHSFFAATQDVAIDAIAIRSVRTGERGSLNAAMQIGKIGGRVLFSGGVPLLEAWSGARLAVPMLVGVLTSMLVLAVRMPIEDHGGGEERPARPGRRRRYLAALVASRRIWRLAAFALIAGLGFEAAGSLSGSWLVDAGFDDGERGVFRLVTAALMAVGGVLGGWLADRRAPRRATRALLLATVAAVALLAAFGSIVLYALVYLAIGAFVAASYAMFMQNANGPLAATVFSMFMGLTNGCEALAAWSSGWLYARFAEPVDAGVGADSSGAVTAAAAHAYGMALLVMAGASLAAWPLLARRGRSA